MIKYKINGWERPIFKNLSKPALREFFFLDRVEYTRNSISREVAEVPKHKRGRQRHPSRLVTPHPRKGLREVGRVRPSLSSPVCRLVPQGSQWFRVMAISSRRDYHPGTTLEQRPVLDYILGPKTTWAIGIQLMRHTGLDLLSSVLWAHFDSCLKSFLANFHHKTELLWWKSR